MPFEVLTSKLECILCVRMYGHIFLYILYVRTYIICGVCKQLSMRVQLCASLNTPNIKRTPTVSWDKLYLRVKSLIVCLYSVCMPRAYYIRTVESG